MNGTQCENNRKFGGGMGKLIFFFDFFALSVSLCLLSGLAF